MHHVANISAEKEEASEDSRISRSFKDSYWEESPQPPAHKGKKESHCERITPPTPILYEEDETPAYLSRGFFFIRKTTKDCFFFVCFFATIYSSSWYRRISFYGHGFKKRSRNSSQTQPSAPEVHKYLRWGASEYSKEFCTSLYCKETRHASKFCGPTEGYSGAFERAVRILNAHEIDRSLAHIPLSANTIS